jgi:Mg2+-importing ATPase
VAALHRDLHQTTIVLRDGVRSLTDVAELVPGDIVALRVGDIVPADLRLLGVNQLECDEAVLTGESLPVEDNRPRQETSGTDLPSCAFMGTVIHQGAGLGIVVSRPGGPPSAHCRGTLRTSGQTAFRLAARLLQPAGEGRGHPRVSIFIINVALRGR